jgi:hypothetical protein
VKKSKALICSNEICLFDEITLSGNIATGSFPTDPAEAYGMGNEIAL